MRRRPILIASLAVLALLLAGGIWLSTQLRVDEPPAESVAVDAFAQAPRADHQDLIANRATHYAVPDYAVSLSDRGASPMLHSNIPDADRAMFQAASLSKPVAALGILMLAEREGIGLDDDIRPHVTSVDLSALPGGDRPVSLRQLLSHMAGATVSGYPGIRRDAYRPSTAEVITDPPSPITPGVTLSGEPGRFAYSGGGYTIAQAFAEDVSGQDFALLMDQLVLRPLGMTTSSFAQPIDPATAPGRIVATTSPRAVLSGIMSPLQQSWHVYPPQAAAGLWTTAPDFDRFLRALDDARRGEPSPIPQSIARAMTTPETEAFGAHYGLGLSVVMEDGALSGFGHSGANAGYRALARIDTRTGHSVVSLTNSASGAAFNTEVVNGLLRAD